jgi:uncharacterized membrane protein YgcG
MNKTFLSSLVLALTILVMPHVAFAFTPPPLNGHHVVDQSGRLSTADVKYLDHQLEVENRQTTNEIAVLVISKLNGEDIKDIGYSTFSSWHLGKSGKDNGVLFLIVTDDRKARIDTGKGVGGALTDVQCNDIIKNQIRPPFKAGNLRKAIDDGTSAAANLLRVDQGLTATSVSNVPVTAPATDTATDNTTPVTEAAAATSTPQSDSVGAGFVLGLLALIGCAIALAAWMFRRKNEDNYSYSYTPPVPAYASPIYSPQPSFSDERTTVPLPTPVPVPVPVPYSRPRAYVAPPPYVPPQPSTSPIYEEREERRSNVVEDVEVAAGVIGAIGAVALILSNDDDDDSDDTDKGWGSGSSSNDDDDDPFTGGGGDCGGGGSDDSLD